MTANNGSAESRFYLERLQQQQQQHQHQRQHNDQIDLRQHLPNHQTLGHLRETNGKDLTEVPPRRDDLVYVHCATTEDEVEDDEEEPSAGMRRSRSWLCCPGDRRGDRTIPIQVEADNRDREQNVSDSSNQKPRDSDEV